MSFLAPGVLDNLSTDADVFRRFFEFMTRGNAGVRGDADLKVSAPGAMTVRVAAGEALVMGSENVITQGAYHVTNDANIDLSIAAADATNPRNDLVIVKVQDAFYSGASKQAVAVVVTGTPAGSPVDPSLTSHPNNFVLARVVVPALAASVTSGMITDLRPYAFTKDLPGSAGWQLRNGLDTADNIKVTDAGLVTLRNALSIPPSAAGTMAATSFGTVPVKIAEIALGSATSSITFSSIPAGFRSLLVTWQTQTDQGSAQDLRLRFNGDTGNNYFVSGYQVTSGGVGSTQSQASVGSLYVCSNGTLMSSGWALVPGYGSAFMKGVQMESTQADSGAIQARYTCGLWTGTAAVTSLTLLAAVGNLNTNSVFALYGLP